MNEKAASPAGQNRLESGIWLDFVQEGGEEKRGECLGVDPRHRQEEHGEENSRPSYLDSLNFFMGF